MSTKEGLRRSGTSCATSKAYATIAVSVESYVTSVARAETSSKTYHANTEEVISTKTASLPWSSGTGSSRASIGLGEYLDS